MYRIMSMLAIMLATAVMGIAFTYYAMERAGKPTPIMQTHQQHPVQSSADDPTDSNR